MIETLGGYNAICLDNFVVDPIVKCLCEGFMKKTLAADTPAGVLPDPRHSFWSRIAHEIGEAIRQGTYAPGERLPTEHALAQQYGVNRHTVRRSLATLGQLGLVRTSQGSGTYVEEFAVEVMLGKRTRHRQSLAQAGLKGGLRLLQTHVEEAEPGVAQALGLPAGAPVLHLVVLGDGAGQVLHASDRYFPLPRLAGLDAHLHETGSITEALHRLGVSDYTRRESRITARLPSVEVAALLQQPLTRPTLRVTSVNVDSSGCPVEYACTWFAGDRVAISVDHAHE
jgi:GntR family phosphonate transport system transcriptional regulator